jgi:hypothetical protein
MLEPLSVHASDPPADALLAAEAEAVLLASLEIAADPGPVFVVPAGAVRLKPDARLAVIVSRPLGLEVGQHLPL